MSTIVEINPSAVTMNTDEQTPNSTLNEIRDGFDAGTVSLRGVRGRGHRGRLD